MAQPPVVIIGHLLCFVRVILLYWWTTSFVFFGNSQDSVALSINFITVQYGLALIDLLLVIGVRTKVKEFIYIWVVTTVLNMILVSQQLFLNLYQSYLGQKTHPLPSEEISNITYVGLFIFSLISLLLVMGTINNLKPTTKENCEDINEKGRRYSV